MNIKEIKENKKDFLDILLIGDEDEKMVDKYLECGNLYALYENNELMSVSVVLEIGSTTVEIKNLATYPKYQNKGYASKLIDFIQNKYKEDFKYLILGTGENKATLDFYKKRGFVEFKRIKNFFIDNYQKPIFENNIQLVDMIYLRKRLR